MSLLNALLGHWTGIALLSVVLLLLYHLFGTPTLRRNGSPLKRPRDSLPLLGNAIVFLQPRQKLFTWFADRERRDFGLDTYQIVVPTLPPGIVINDPANVDYVFKNETLFNKGAFVKDRSWDLFGHGIINADGELWRAQRKAGLHFLNTPNLRVLTDVALPRYLSQSVSFLTSRADGVTVVDLQAVFHEITSQLMGKMAYNMEMHAVDDFTLAFDHASGATAERFQNPLWPVTEIFLGSKMRAAVAIVKEHGKRIVASAMRDREALGSAPERDVHSDDELEDVSGSLIQSLLDSIGDKQMVADAALNYLSAGRDTVAQALTWTFYLLSKHPEALDRVRKDATTVLATKSNPPLDTTLFTSQSMPYTMAVFYEAMRLYPPIPLEIKQCTQATTLPDGTFLPASTVVLWSPWAMNRSRAIWGDDADLFRPERWLSKSQPTTFIARGAAEYPVFNGGARMCLGKKMAELVAAQVIPAVAWSFDIRPAWDVGKERVSKSSLTLPMEGGLPCFVGAREASVDDALGAGA